MYTLDPITEQRPTAAEGTVRRTEHVRYAGLSSAHASVEVVHEDSARMADSFRLAPRTMAPGWRLRRNRQTRLPLFPRPDRNSDTRVSLHGRLLRPGQLLQEFQSTIGSVRSAKSVRFADRRSTTKSAPSNVGTRVIVFRDRMLPMASSPPNLRLSYSGLFAVPNEATELVGADVA
jgi:hypothetical protein